VPHRVGTKRVLTTACSQVEDEVVNLWTAVILGTCWEKQTNTSQDMAVIQGTCQKDGWSTSSSWDQSVGNTG